MKSPYVRDSAAAVKLQKKVVVVILPLEAAMSRVSPDRMKMLINRKKFILMKNKAQRPTMRPWAERRYR